MAFDPVNASISPYLISASSSCVNPQNPRVRVWSCKCESEKQQQDVQQLQLQHNKGKASAAPGEDEESPGSGIPTKNSSEPGFKFISTNSEFQLQWACKHCKYLCTRSECECECNYATSRVPLSPSPLDYDMIRDIQSREILHWNYRNLAVLPPELFTAQVGLHVKEFYLKRNCLESIPPDIRKLRNLTNLYLGGNQLTELQSELSDLQNLRVLDLSQNQISKVSASIGTLQCLEQLILTDNQIRLLPKELGNCRRLISLELSSNSIHELPDELITGLGDSLEELGIDRNPLTHLPRNISQLRGLRYLSCCHCDLQYLPGFPFYLIESHWKQQRAQCENYHPWKSDIEFSPVTSGLASKINFHFDNNPRLNQLPIWVLQVWGFDFEVFGCATGRGVPGGRVRVRDCPGRKEVHLEFDPGIEIIHDVLDQSLPTLVEVSLRTITIASSQNVSENASKCTRSFNLGELPANLAQRIALGPAAQCFVCKQAIYTEIWLMPFRISNSSEGNANALDLGASLARVPYSAFVFCTANCVFRFQSEVIGSAFAADLELVTSSGYKLKLLELV